LLQVIFPNDFKDLAYECKKPKLIAKSFGSLFIDFDVGFFD